MTTPTLREQAGGAPVPTVRDQLSALQPRFASALPKGMSVERFLADCQTLLSNNPGLGKCDSSFFGAVMTCAQLGLRPGVLGEAYVVPYGSKAQLVLGYQGLIALAYRSPLVASIVGRVVREGDTIRVTYGSADRIEHRPLVTGIPAKSVGYYVTATLSNGKTVPYYMTREEVEAWRDKHAKAGSGPWKDHFDAMALKTCMRQLAKWLPKSVDLARGLAVDGGVRHDVSPDLEPETATDFIDGDVVEDTEEPS